MQLKLPKAKFDPSLAYRSVEKALMDEPDQAWFFPIEDTFLALVRRAQRQVDKASGNGKIIVGDVTPDMPYDCTVVVADQGSHGNTHKTHNIHGDAEFMTGGLRE